MSEYKHGAYGLQDTQNAKSAVQSQGAMIYIGTAPVHTVKGGAANVNRPIAVRNIAEAKAYFGYSENWADYTLCEAMHVHLQMGGVGPLILINVLDPAVHKAAEKGSLSAKTENGRIRILSAGDAILDSVTVDGKEKDTDYAISYDPAKEIITITEIITGALGSDELSISWDRVDPAAVENAELIGSSDGMGLNTGLYAIKNVYQLTGYIPSMLAAPGWSSDPEVHEAMYNVSQRVNKHWHVYMRCDLPIIHNETPITLLNAATWKKANGYNKENETVYFPMAKGTDGRIYHLSTLAGGNLHGLLNQQGGIPYTTPSNTACPIIQSLYLGEDSEGRVYDDALINEQLNQHGIASAAYTGGRWAIWGAHSADYTPDEKNDVNVAETNRMMLYFVLNRFQEDSVQYVDKPMPINTLRSIEARWQKWLDDLVATGMLSYGKCMLNAALISRSDIASGDFTFSFNISTTPLAKSLTVYAALTNDGLEFYINEMAG